MASDEPDPSAGPLESWQKDGDPDALNRLLQIEIGVLKHMIRGKRGRAFTGSADTSDIAQEAVMGLLKTKTAPTFSDPRELRGYLWRSAWHLLVRKFEKRKRVVLRLEVEEPPGLERFLRSTTTFQNIDRSERAVAIDFALNLLAPEDRELIRLVYFEDADIATAGAAIGLNRSAANSRLVRARRVLARRLAEWSEIIG